MRITLDEVADWPETCKAKRFWGWADLGRPDDRRLPDGGDHERGRSAALGVEEAGDRPRLPARFYSVPGPLPWLTPADLEVLRENAEADSNNDRLHPNRWTSEDRLAARADLAACTILPGPVPPVRGIRYVATLDIGIANDRTVLTVMHTEQAEAGRRVVLDRIVRWQGSRSAPVDLGEIRDTPLALTMDYYSAKVVLDPHQAVLIAQEARAKGVMVHEFAFTSTSAGRLALSLHQAIKNHRMALPDDEVLLDELISMRLRKNTLGVYRLDHNSGHRARSRRSLPAGRRRER